MRLPLSIPLDERDGTSNQDGRMTNMVAEQYEDKSFIGARPALSRVVNQVGTANGVVCHDGSLISLYGTTFYKNGNGINQWATASIPGVGGIDLWSDCAFGNGVFVAVNVNNSSAFSIYSDDGISWSSATMTVAAWSSVDFVNGRFIALSSLKIAVSTDGRNWVYYDPPEANSWRSVAYANGAYVAISGNGTNRVMTSSDAVTWIASAATEANAWTSIAYGNGVFVAVSSDGTNRVMTSPNGIAWTPQTASEANAWRGLVFAGSQFVAVATSGTNRVMTSPDGVTWTARAAAAASRWIGITYGNGIYVATADIGTPTSMWSADGITWTSLATVDDVNNEWESVCFGKGRFVSVSRDANFGTYQAMYAYGVIPASQGTIADSTYDFAQTST